MKLSSPSAYVVQFLPGMPNCGTIVFIAPFYHATYYAPLVKCLPSRIRTLGAQPIPLFLGNGDCNSASDLCATLARHIAAEAPGAPLVIYGHCIGGVLALETAHKLLSIGRAPDLVAFADTFFPLPALQAENGEYAQRIWIQFTTSFLSRDRAQILLDEGETFWRLTDSEKLKRILALTTLAPNLLLPQKADLPLLEDRFHRFLTWMTAVDAIQLHDYPGDALYLGSEQLRSLKNQHFLRHLVGNVKFSEIGRTHESLIQGESVREVARFLDAAIQSLATEGP